MLKDLRPQGDDKNKINVSRNSVMEAGLRAFARENFDLRNRLHVKFLGEQGIDDGGLSVEFLRLFLNELGTSLNVYRA